MELVAYARFSRATHVRGDTEAPAVFEVLGKGIVQTGGKGLNPGSVLLVGHCRVIVRGLNGHRKLVSQSMSMDVTPTVLQAHISTRRDIMRPSSLSLPPEHRRT
jgi:hypothetical protein